MSRVDFTGQQLGPYLVRELIGLGGMGDVYRAYQLSMKREVALKVIQLNPESADDEFRRRFDQEAETIAVLEHPHILPVFDYGIDRNVAYLAMRLVRGGTLERLVREEPLSLDQVADIFGQVARALDYAHRRGVIHRDLKPSNILLDQERHAYLTDFGVAKIIGGSAATITVSGKVVGTPAYMAPEQLRGARIDHRADIFSLGMILHYMLTRRAVYEGESPLSLIYQQLEETPTSPRAVNPEVPLAVDTVVMRALEKDPRKRFDSAEEMAHALDVALGRATTPRYVTPLSPATILAMQTEQTSRPSTLTGRLLRLPRPVFWGAAAVIVLVVLLIVLLSIPKPDFHPPTVVPGQRVSAEEMVASDEEIARAARHLGDRGFIAYIACNQESVFFAAHAREMKDIAEGYDLDFRVYDSRTDAYQEIIEIERARTDGAKALIICVLDPDLLADTLASVEKAGIPLVLNNVSVPPSYGGVIVTADNYRLGLESGRLAGQIVAEEMGGQADVVILDYPDLPIIVERADGMEAGLLEFAPDANIIGRFLGGTIENAEASIRDLIEQGAHFNVILSINDVGAYGAINALEAAGFAPDSVVIVGVDAEAKARQYIRNGHFMRGSIEVAGVESGARPTIYAIVKLLAGSTVPEVVLVPPGQVITRETFQAGD